MLRMLFILLVIFSAMDLQAGSKLESEKRKFLQNIHPLPVFYAELSGRSIIVYSEKYQDLFLVLPDELRPDKLHSSSMMLPVIEKALTHNLTFRELNSLNKELNSPEGKKIMKLIWSSVPKLGTLYVDGKVLSMNDLISDKSDSNLDVSEDELESIEKAYKKIKHLRIYLESLPNISGNIDWEMVGATLVHHYENNTFSDKDAELCLNTNEAKFIVYAFVVCDAGYRSGDYQSTLVVAEQYYSGANHLRERDIKKAKDIYREILNVDKTGEAHYMLAMLIKAVPAQDEIIEESVCFLKKSLELGYQHARSALRDFTREQREILCY